MDSCVYVFAGILVFVNGSLCLFRWNDYCVEWIRVFVMRELFVFEWIPVFFQWSYCFVEWIMVFSIGIIVYWIEYSAFRWNSFFAEWSLVLFFRWNSCFFFVEWIIVFFRWN